MKFDKSKVDEELRAKGEVIHFILPYYTKTKMKIINKISSLIFKGKAPSDGFINYSQEYAKREDGSKLRVCVYSKKDVKKHSVVVLWFHGGGYSMSEPEQDFVFFKNFVKKHNAIVVAPDYTKALEKPFPAAFEDAKLALEFSKSVCERFGLNKSIFVGGDSAGGGLALSLAIYARDAKDDTISFCMPIYPMISSKHTETSKNNVMPVWNTKSNDIAWKIYLGEMNKDDDFKYASPSSEENYVSLPPMLTYVGTEDPFYAETIELVENLKKAGVQVDYKFFEGCYHGFDVACPKAKKSKEAKQFLIDGFEKALKEYLK